MIIYEDFGGRTLRYNTHHTAIYLGQTTNFANRLSAHKTAAIDGGGASHYRLAAKAETMVMVPLVLQKTGQVPEDFLDIAEFTMVCLFKSWFAALYSPKEANVVGAYSNDFDACNIFSRLVDQVRASSGWALTQTYGLNWNTPIIKNVSREAQWTAWHDAAKELYVYRTRRNIFFMASSGDYTIFWHKRDRVQVPKEVFIAAGLKHGQAIHLVAEIHKRGSEYLNHPFRFIRLPPNIGKNPELEKIKAFAIKMQWLPEGTTQWKECYLERTNIWTYFSNQAAILRVYQLGLSLLSDIEGIQYSGGPDWLSTYLSGKVQFLRYNHLEQKYMVETIRSKSVQWPRDYTMQENTQRLTEMFPPHRFPDTIIGSKPAAGFLPQNRSACDMCYTQRTVSKSPLLKANVNTDMFNRLPSANTALKINRVNAVDHSIDHALLLELRASRTSFRAVRLRNLGSPRLSVDRLVLVFRSRRWLYPLSTPRLRRRNMESWRIE